MRETADVTVSITRPSMIEEGAGHVLEGPECV
jgi:hypothetical protein